MRLRTLMNYCTVKADRSAEESRRDGGLNTYTYIHMIAWMHTDDGYTNDQIYITHLITYKFQ